MSDDAYEAALVALARAENKSVEELRRELEQEGLRTRLGRSRAVQVAEPAPSREPLARRGRRDEDETPEEARERFYEEEAALIDGVHGFGGQTAGGIFGDGPIATELYDPMAQHRATSRASAHVNIEQTRALGELTRTVAALAERVGLNPALTSGPRRALPRKRGR